MSRIPDEQSMIRITPAEVASSHVDDLLKRQANLRGEGISRDRRRAWYYGNWFIFSIAGLLGAVAAWGLWEPWFNDLAYIQGKIEQIEWAGGANLPAELDLPDDVDLIGLGSITVNNEKFLLLPQTRPLGERDPNRGIDREALQVGKEVGLYVDDEAADEVGMGAVVYVDPNPPAMARPTQSFQEHLKHQQAAGFLLFPTVAALAGLLIGAADGLVCRLWRRVLIAGLVGFFVGFVGCFVTSIIAGMIYMPLRALAENQANGQGAGGLGTLGLLIQVGGRGLAWTLAGMAMGLGQGIALRSGRLLLYGFLGGAIGGLLGGMLFDPIHLILVGEGAPSAHLSRLVGFGVIGLSIGLMIGIVELLARDAWLRMVQGPLSGKEFLVFKDQIQIGASPRSDIYLFNDPEVAERHAVIRAAADQYEIESVDRFRPVLVNGRPVNHQRLRHGDEITLGRTVFVFQRRRTD